MRRQRTYSFRLALGLAAVAVLGACGDNLGGQGTASDTDVSQDANILFGTAVTVAPDISKCSRYPSRC